MLRTLDLFSGIGGFSLGLERTGGFKTVAFCEIEDYPRRVLAKHWPGVPIYDDVRTLTAERLRADGIGVDVICGGFPCQDISVAGRRAGMEGARSGLWSEIARLAGELRPRLIIVENVAALLSGDDGRWFGAVLGDLAALGFDAEWHCIPASALGAPHRRDRIWIVAYAANDRTGRRQQQSESSEGARHVADTEGQRCREVRQHRERSTERATGRGEVLADARRSGCAGPGPYRDAGDRSPLVTREAIESQHGRVADFWRTEPDVGRVAHGVPHRVDRLAALGNAVVPQIPEAIGRAILASEARA